MLLNYFTCKKKEKYDLSRILIAVILVTSIFSFLHLSRFDTISVRAELENPVVTWNKFTGQLGVQHNHGPPDLARDYVLVHVAIYDALLTANNMKGNP